jgi:hypothetical protein
MDALIVFGLTILGLVLACLILPWINRNSIKMLRKEMAQLKRDMAELRMGARKPVDDSAAQSQKAEVTTELSGGGNHAEHAPAQHTVPITPDAAAPAAEGNSLDLDRSREKPSSLHDEMPAANHTEEQSKGIEHQFGGMAFVWLGAVALALAGFFLVKYSIEAGLLSPAVRVTMGIIFGIGLLYAGNEVRTRPGFANGVRIAQALSGAGIAVLYARLLCRNESLRSDTGPGRFYRIGHCNGLSGGAIRVAREAHSLTRIDGRVPHACPRYIAPSAGIDPVYISVPGARRTDGGYSP